jgi:hypothetical protein
MCVSYNRVYGASEYHTSLRVIQQVRAMQASTVQLNAMLVIAIMCKRVCHVAMPVIDPSSFPDSSSPKAFEYQESACHASESHASQCHAASECECHASEVAC